MRSYHALGADPVTFALTVCDGCGQELPVAADRRHCLDCGKDWCAACTVRPGGVPGCDALRHRCAPYPGLPPLDLARMAQARAALRAELVENQRFRAAATFFSEYALAILDGHAARLGLPAGTLAVAERTVDRIVQLRSMGRFVDFFARRTLAGTSLSGSAQVFSQGVNDANRWKGLPLLKGVFDYALYPLMLAGIRPATVFEFGSEAGGSALWLADTAAALGLACHVHSVDMVPPAVRHECVTFIAGDSNAAERAIPASLLREAPHPWIVIEDSHVNIGGILAHFSGFMQPGDYFIVEDENAEADIGRHLLSHPGQYLVDSFYTDYFGYNATCSQDQILRFMEPAA